MENFPNELSNIYSYQIPWRFQSSINETVSSNGESLLYMNLTFIWEIFLKQHTLVFRYRNVFRNRNQNSPRKKPLRRNSNSVSCQAPNRERAKMLGNLVFSLTSMCGIHDCESDMQVLSSIFSHVVKIPDKERILFLVKVTLS
jgi:hypothetical protein